MLTPVIQEEATGCGIASVANILGKSYQEMKAIANSMGIYADNKSLWSDTEYVRKLLTNAGVSISAEEMPFDSWDKLPDTALLAIKPHCIDGINYWHWVVFKRINGQSVVLDSASYLPCNLRKDFDAMQPKWFIAVKGL